MSNLSSLQVPNLAAAEVAAWRQALSIALTAPSCAALLSLWLPMPLALTGAGLVCLLLGGQWLLARTEGDQPRILLSSQWSLLASLLICLAVIWWQGPMAALAAALSLGTGWAWFGYERAFMAQLLSSGLSLLLALMLGQDEQLALLGFIYLAGLWLCLLPPQPAATPPSGSLLKPTKTQLIFWGSRIPAPLLLLALSTLLFLLSPRLQGAAWLPMKTTAPLQLGGGQAIANREFLPTRNRLQQEWLLTVAADTQSPAAGDFAAFGGRFSLEQLPAQAASGPVLARVKSPQALNLQVSRFDYFDGSQWINSGGQAEAVPIPQTGLSLSADSRLQLAISWLQPSSSALAVPGGWQFLQAPTAALLLGAQSLALPQIPPAGFSYQVGSHGLSLDGHSIAQRDDLLHPNYLAVPEALSGPLQDWLRTNLPTLAEPWQKALWLEHHLQTRYGANRAAVLPSYKRDPVLFYLNEQGAGRSETAASALTLLLRSLGIPARLSCGWALQQRNPFTGLFDLTAANAHCYSEAHINNHGWVELEPSSLFAARPSAGRLSLGVIEWQRTLTSPWRALLTGFSTLALIALFAAVLWRLWPTVQKSP
ncbi:MAG TPA: transglutaminase family protein, partial [Cellvibrionaceae bacterium]|nr:transglutaminase family protein [Cellvibrionaceae bacterium]